MESPSLVHVPHSTCPHPGSRSSEAGGCILALGVADSVWAKAWHVPASSVCLTVKVRQVRLLPSLPHPGACLQRLSSDTGSLSLHTEHYCYASKSTTSGRGESAPLKQRERVQRQNCCEPASIERNGHHALLTGTVLF